MLIILPTYVNMKNKRRFNILIATSLCISALFYVIFSFLLVLVYNNSENGIESNILYNMNNTSIPFYICTLLVSLMCVFSYPVIVMPALELIEPQRNENDTKMFVITPKRILFRIIMIIFISIIAFLFPSFNIVISLYIFLELLMYIN